MQSWGLTDPGCVRKQNQDSYRIEQLDRGNLLCIVCDGMGGAKSGNIASSLAVDVFVEEVRRCWKPVMEQEKVDQIRIYSGGQFKAVSEAEAGTVCAVTGLAKTYAGQGLGAVASAEKPFLEPVLSYQIELPPSCDVYGTLLKLRQLEEESPQP